MKITFKLTFQKSTIVTIILLLLSPLAFILPSEYFWENNFFENSQVVLLTIGFLINLKFVLSLKSRYSKAIKSFWISILPVWLILIVRELSWGRVFYLEEMGPHGPEFFSLKDLWFGPYVHPILAVVIVITLFFLIRSFYKLKPHEKICISVIDFIGAILFITLATVVFEKGLIESLKPYSTNLEEYFELIAYWNLVSGSMIAMKYHEKSFHN